MDLSAYLGDEVELVHVVVAGEQRLPADELREDAAHRPHVDGRRVLGARQQQLGGPVPEMKAHCFDQLPMTCDLFGES